MEPETCTAAHGEDSDKDQYVRDSPPTAAEEMIRQAKIEKLTDENQKLKQKTEDMAKVNEELKQHNEEMRQRLIEKLTDENQKLKQKTEDMAKVHEERKQQNEELRKRLEAMEVCRPKVTSSQRSPGMQQKLTDTWADMKEGEAIKKAYVNPATQEFKDIATRFVREVQTGKYSSRITWNKANLKITKIVRIQNKILYQQYAVKKEVISNEKKHMMPANIPMERDVWHGTTADKVDSIIEHGFNRSNRDINGIWYGHGVYFAKDASFSARGWTTAGANTTGPISAQIFLVKAVTGWYCKGTDKMHNPPPINPRQPLVLYDSAVDNEQNPMEFVIFNDTQCYPAYLIYFSA